MAEATTTGFYDAFYSAGGWKYSLLREWWWHRRHLVRRFRLARGMNALEVACGMGFHTNLLCRMGLRCVGLDACDTAVNIARQRYPRRRFDLADAAGDLPFPVASFDVIFTRGCSPYHYDLMAPRTLATTANLLRYLAPGGWFVLIIASDLSGRRDPDRIWHNRLVDYRAHFQQFERPFSVDWYKGMVICGLRNVLVEEVRQE